MLKKITALLMALTMILTVSSCGKKSVGGSAGMNKNDNGAEEAVTAPETDENVAMWSDTTTVTVSMFTYYFNAYYKTFADNYSGYLETLGLDTSKDLKEQKFEGERTWFEYLVLLCYDEIKATVSLADAAKAEGVRLSSDDIDEIEAALEAYKELAVEAGQDVDTYVSTLFGKSVNLASAEKCMRLRALASAYYDLITADMAAQEDECEEYFLSSPNKFLYYDCLRIVVPDEYTARLCEATDADGFKEAIRSIITEKNFEGKYDKYAETIDRLTESKLVTRCTYSDSLDQAVWAFDESRAPYDIFTESVSTGNTAVTMILPTEESGKYSDVLYRDAVSVKNLKYLLLEDEEEAKSIYEKWAKDGSEKSFDKLIAKYGGDTAENIDRSDCVAELSQWIFADERKSGDSTVITVEDTGTYLLYMLDDGEASWIVDAVELMKSEIAESELEKLLEKYPSQYSDAVYDVEVVPIG